MPRSAGVEKNDEVSMVSSSVALILLLLSLSAEMEDIRTGDIELLTVDTIIIMSEYALEYSPSADIPLVFPIAALSIRLVQ